MKIKITDEGYAVIDGDTYIGKQVQKHRRLDFDQRALKQYLPFFTEKGVMINVGANIGCCAYAFIQKASEVICFEPNPPVFECLRHNLERFPNVKLYNEAISDSVRPFEMLDFNKKSLIERAQASPWLCITPLLLGSERGNVGATPIFHKNSGEKKTNYIDNFNFKRIDFILIDAEGSEFNILKGAEQTISKLKPIIVMELNQVFLKAMGATKEDIFDFLDGQGYTYRNIYGDYPLDAHYLDIICMPTDKYPPSL